MQSQKPEEQARCLPGQEQQDNWKGDICYLENICGAEQPWTRTIDDELNIDACVSYVFKLGIVLIE